MDSFSEAINISSRGAFETSVARLDDSLSLVSNTVSDTDKDKSFDKSSLSYYISLLSNLTLHCYNIIITIHLMS